MILAFALVLLSFGAGVGCIYLSRRFGFGVDSAFGTSPQKMHASPTSRLGGVGIFVAFCVGYLWLWAYSGGNEGDWRGGIGAGVLSESLSSPSSSLPSSPLAGVFSGGSEAWGESIFIALGLSLVFVSGFLEDILGTLKPTLRLVIQICGVGLMLFVPIGVIQHLEPLVFLPLYWGVAFSVFGIVGVCNAINIIDGLNGLASGVAMLALGAIAFVSRDSGGVVFEFSLLALCGVAGFWVLNFPFGRIFLGDGGAYFLGALIGILLGMLSNQGVSAWFGLSVMIYPVWEVVFSILRRKLGGHKAMQPDGLHLHTLLYKRLGSNPLASMILLIVYGIYLALVLCFAREAWDFIFASLGFVGLYSVGYFGLRRMG